MFRPPSQDGITQAARRPLRIFASDPQEGRTFGNRSSIEVVNEQLSLGPVGPRLEVIDYDGSQQCFYKPVDLDNRAILMRGGLEPSESDPRFHQQMVYAVARKTLENFDRALGRILLLGSQNRKRGAKYPRLRLFPHAFYGANAFYDNNLNAILFGYFKAEAADVGPNLPHQTVFTCLSHDIITHEMTHAIVDRLRPFFLEPSNIDVLAFHEGFADIVAIFQHFSFKDILREHIQRTRSNISTPNPLIELARQFGYATGSGKALRSALDKPESKLYETTFEPHDRGSILVAAVFDGFNMTYQNRIADLVRIATGGTGTLPQGDLHPDLVNRIADEAAQTAQRVLDMCIRAFDYMPPVDVTFGDFLRALVTADFELAPRDEYNFRGAMIEAFRMRGIYPEGVTSLAEESLLWTKAEKELPSLGKVIPKLLEQVFFSALRSFDVSWQKTDDWRGYDPKQTCVTGEEEEDIKLDVSPEMAKALHDYATDNADALGLDGSAKIQVRGFHPVFRVSPTGRLLIELNAQFAQVDHSVKGQFGGIPFRGGCTLVASSDGDFRYLISKPMRKAGGDAARQRMGEARFARQQEYLLKCDMQNALMPYITDKEYQERMLEMMNFTNLCGG
jgi:hypothetical protein